MNEQINAIKEFESYLMPLRLVYSKTFESDLFDTGETNKTNFNLRTYLQRQRLLLHGYEGKKLKYIPKVGSIKVLHVCS